MIKTQLKTIIISLIKPVILLMCCSGLNLQPYIQARETFSDTTIKAADLIKQTTILYKPLRDESRLMLPKKPDGYRWSIESTSPAGIIASDGTLTRPPEDTMVSVTLKLISEKNPKDFARITLKVPIDKPYSLPVMSAAGVRSARDRFERQKLGFFVHYVPFVTTDFRGKKMSDIDSLANSLDVKQFAQDMADFGVEYVMFTAWHFNASTFYPSVINRRWRDDRRSQDFKIDDSTRIDWDDILSKRGINPGRFNIAKTWSDTDLIDRLATELSGKGIDLILYTHPVDGHDFPLQDREQTGWNDCSNDHGIWNQFQNELYDELCRRYGDRIKGIWFDGQCQHYDKMPRLPDHEWWDFGWHPYHSAIQHDLFRRTLLAYNPGLALIANVAWTQQKNPFPEWSSVDYRCWESSPYNPPKGMPPINPDSNKDDVFTWPGTREQVALIVGGGWTVNPRSKEARYSPEILYRYLVLQASVSRSGGLACAAGCFPGTARENPNGNIWDGNLHETMVALNKLIAPVAESIRNTNTGKAYITEDHQWLGQKKWGVSTESPDGKFVYLHILKPPSGQTLILDPAADGSTLGGPAVIIKTGQRASFKKTSTGYKITLPKGVNWDTLDTVIKVKRL